MTRRTWLLAVGGLAVSVWWWRRRPRDPASHIRAYFPYLRLSDGAVDGFVRDFTTFYGWFPLGPLPDKVSMQFLQSTDFFKHGADENRTIEYASFYDPKITACYNPFAKFD